MRKLALAILATLALAVPAGLPVPAIAQEAAADAAAEVDRSATGGAQTLEDILARQRGEVVDDSFRRSLIGDGTAAGIAAQLGTLGGESDSEVWRALRYGHDSVTVSAGGDVARNLIQDGGMAWYQFREGRWRPMAATFCWVRSRR